MEWLLVIWKKEELVILQKHISNIYEVTLNLITHLK